MRKLDFGLAVAINPTYSWLRSSDARHDAGDLRQLCCHVARPGSYLLRLDKRLVQSEMGLHHGWVRGFW